MRLQGGPSDCNENSGRRDVLRSAVFGRIQARRAVLVAGLNDISPEPAYPGARSGATLDWIKSAKNHDRPRVPPPRLDGDARVNPAHAASVAYSQLLVRKSSDGGATSLA